VIGRIPHREGVTRRRGDKERKNYPKVNKKGKEIVD
jgi:hypothetical protein